jgi:phosphoesterase RecJ-like protein
MTPSPVPEDLLRKVRQGNRFLLTSHASPDGDAVGSEIGLARCLRRLGKSATIWNADPTPAVYQELPGADRIHVGSDPPEGFPDVFDTIVLLECSSPARSGLGDHLEPLQLVNIDHHLGNQHYGEVNWVDTGAPAVGEMVFRLARALKVDLDTETATALYLTLVTDTGGFRFSNTSAEAFAAAGSLVTHGASPERVAGWLYESRSVAMLRLLGEMLQSLALHEDGRIASALLTRDMFECSGATRGDSEGLIDYPRSIAGVQAAVLLRELDDGQVKVSLRSRGEVDVEQIARSNGGGGHRNAAGFTLEGTLESAREQAVEALAPLIRPPREDG